MAAGEWHPFVGPADYIIPDDPQEAIYSAAFSAGIAIGTAIAHQIRIPQEMVRMAAHHQVGTRVAMRATASRQLGRWTVQRGMGVALSSVPIVGWTVAAFMLAASLPRQGVLNSSLVFQDRLNGAVVGSWTR